MSNAERFKALFDGFTGAHGRFRPSGGVRERDGKAEGISRTVKGLLPPKAWDQHLLGAGDGVGVVPLRDDDTVKFAAIDIDKYGEDNARKEAARLAAFPVVVCRSKSGGSHIYVFFKEPLPGDYVFDKLRDLAFNIGADKSEIFPKQIKRAQKEDIGNWINLPYYGDVRRAVHPDGHYMELEEFLDYAEARLVTREQCDRMKRDERREQEQKKAQDNAAAEAAKYEGRQFVDAPGVFGDGPPCLATVLGQTQRDPATLDGMRNSFLLNVAVYLKEKHAPDDFTEELDAINKLLPSPIPFSEVQNLARGVLNKDYKYKCKSAPINAVCQRSICWTRRYGVTPPEQRQKSKTPTLNELGLTIEEVLRTTADPPVWYMTINRVRIMFKDSKLILNLNELRSIVANNTGKVIPALKFDDFIAIIAPIMQGAQIVEVEDAFSPAAQFDQHLRAFVRNSVTDDPEHVSASRVYHHGGRAVFKPGLLLRYLRTEGQKIDNNVVNEYLRDRYEGRSYNRTIKGQTVAVVDISLPEVQNEDYDVPHVNEPFSS